MKNVKNVLLFALMAVLSLCATSCSSSSSDTQLESYKKVNAELFYDNIESSKKNGAPQIIDYRSAEEYAAGHIPGAVNIPVLDRNAESEIKNGLAKYAFTPEGNKRNIYTYGSLSTSNTLGFYLAGIISKEGWGISRTFHLLEGFEGWEKAGYPVEK